MRGCDRLAAWLRSVREDHPFARRRSLFRRPCRPTSRANGYGAFGLHGRHNGDRLSRPRRLRYDLLHIARLPRFVRSKAAREVARVVATERGPQGLLIVTHLRLGALKAVFEDHAARLEIAARLEHGLVALAIFGEVVTIDLPQAHREIEALPLKLTSRGHRFGQTTRLTIEAAAHDADRIGIPRRFGAHHALERGRVNVRGALGSQLFKRQGLRRRLCAGEQRNSGQQPCRHRYRVTHLHR
ncbi:hypothetical protein KOJCDNHJ_04440 (plasmid) [Xanthomonas citri pv. punicae]|nr:hypothetical protein KOJCDNHJ_04440 [Xanthomonas citri pv. punicae]